jgi:threonine/homoserine/homoserine lactone efflux protein
MLLISGLAVPYIITCSMAQSRRAGLASVGSIETANLVHVVAMAHEPVYFQE